jgi:hypothetical protein
MPKAFGEWGRPGKKKEENGRKGCGLQLVQLGGKGSYSNRIDEIANQACRTEKGSFRSGVNHWLRFRESEGHSRDDSWMKGEEEMVVAETLMSFGLYLVDHTTANWDSIEKYLGEVRKVVEIQGRRARIQLVARHATVLAAMKKGRKKKASRKKALTARMLRRWRGRLEKSNGGGSKEEWSCWVAMSLMFFGLLRGSEVIGRQGKREGLTWGDVTFLYNKGKLDAMDLNIRRSKTDAFGFGATVRIFLDETEEANPVKWLFQKFKEENPTEDMYVTEGAVSGKAISYLKVNTAIKLAASKEGEDPKDWATHSGRAGGCTAMYLGGASGEQVKAAGRWSSDCYLRYIRVSPWNRRKWMKAMSGTDKGPSWEITMDTMMTGN